MRVHQLARQLAARHDVTLLSYAEPGEETDFPELASELRVRTVEKAWIPGLRRRVRQAASFASTRPYACRSVYSHDMQRAIDELCAEEPFDVIQLESTLLCDYDFPRDTPLVLDEHNIEYELYQRMYESEHSLARRVYNYVEYRRFRSFERRSWQRVDGVLVCSERELPIVREYAADVRAAVAPNGVDLDYFSPDANAPEPGTLVFNGYLDYRPNYDAAVHLVNDIMPVVRTRHPEARLAIVGRYLHADLRLLRAPGVTITGEVPDIRPHVGGASVVCVPIRMGGGTRLKVVEALAMGKPIVSTSLGCEGIAVRAGEQLLIADAPAAFAARILDVLDSPELGASLGRRGRLLVEQEYSWDVAGERVDTLYRTLAAGPTEPPRGSAASALAQ
jgi:glycosyltransferase involved in cell wall biosynthesis